VNRKKIERKFVVNRFVWTKICSGGKSSLVKDSFRCVQVRFHTKTMKKLVFFTKCSLMTGFRCGQSPLWTESVVDRFYCNSFRTVSTTFFLLSKLFNTRNVEIYHVTCRSNIVVENFSFELLTHLLASHTYTTFAYTYFFLFSKERYKKTKLLNISIYIFIYFYVLWAIA
jgi:hypothetical protein